MAQTFLIFNFGSDEDAAQQARHRIEGWKQGFRLDKKLLLKFDRETPAKDDGAAGSAPDAKAGINEPEGSHASEPEATENSGAKSTSPSRIHMMVRLDFSDHEKLTHHRWIERIPSEEPFQAAHPKIVRSGDPEFSATAERFDSLD